MRACNSFLNIIICIYIYLYQLLWEYIYMKSSGGVYEGLRPGPGCCRAGVLDWAASLEGFPEYAKWYTSAGGSAVLLGASMLSPPPARTHFPENDNFICSCCACVSYQAACTNVAHLLLTLDTCVVYAPDLILYISAPLQLQGLRLTATWFVWEQRFLLFCPYRSHESGCPV